MADYSLDKILSGYKCGGIVPFAEADAENWADIPFWIPTGCCSLDYAIGGFKRGYRGGIPAGRIIEINGLESTGKSALLSHIVRGTCNGGGAFFHCDAEHATPDERLVVIGTDLSRFRRIEKPKSLEEAEEAIKEQLCDEESYEYGEQEEAPKATKGKKEKKGKKKKAKIHFDVVLEEFFEICETTLKRFRKAVPDPKIPVVFGLDSLAVIETAAQAATDDPNMKDKIDTASVMASHFKGFCQTMAAFNGTLVMVNQLREKVGVNFGDPLYSYGGNAKNFAFSLRIRMQHAKKIKASEDPTFTSQELLADDVVGIQGHGEIVKNKVAEPFRKFRFPLYFDNRGILDEQCFAQMIIDREKWRFEQYADIFQKKSKKKGDGEGNTFFWKGKEIGTGESGLVQAFLGDPMLRDEMEEELFA